MNASSFLLDIPYSELNEDSFRQNLLLAERPAVLRGVAVPGNTPDQENAFTRCLPLFSSFEAMETVALSNNNKTSSDDGYDLEAAGSPEVASNAFMSCDRRLYRDIPVKSVKEALSLIKRSKTSEDDREESTSALYMKLPLTSCPKILKHLRLEEFLLKPEHQVTWCEHPMLLKPGNCFAWLYVGQRGSSSPSHVDVMGSDAVLACFAGLKEWAMVHPFDKHLVMSTDGSEMADLFNIDHDKFPNARYARISFFEQRPGDVVFTPGNAPHAVRNIEDSISLTFNFLDKATGGIKAEQFMSFTMKNKTESTKTLPATFTFRLFSPSFQTDLRLRVPEWGAGWELPKDEWMWRTSAGLNELYKAAEPIRAVVTRSNTFFRPVGVTVHDWDLCADYFFESKSDEDLANLVRELNSNSNNQNEGLSQTPLCSAKWPLQPRKDSCFSDPALPSREKSGDEKFSPEITFPQLDSHFGRFSAFPPLCSCLGYMWHFDQPSFADAFPLIGEMRKSLSSNYGQPVMWHYSRFPFKNANNNNDSASASWCKTQLFYSSPSIDGPVSLFPLLEDGTLLGRSPLQQQQQQLGEETSNENESTTSGDKSPNFVSLTWNIDKLMSNFQSGALCPIQILDFGVILQQKLISQIYMQLDSFEEISKAAHCLGLDEFPSDAKTCVDHGMEKVLALLMNLTARPGVVGFKYTHTFSAVREPDTLCLVGSAASYLLSVDCDEKTKDLHNTKLLLQLCQFVKGPFENKDDDDAAGALAGQSMEILGSAFFSSSEEEEAETDDESKKAEAVKKKLEMTMNKFLFIEKVFDSIEEDLKLQKDTLVKVESEEDEGYVLFRRQSMRLGMIRAAVQHFRSSMMG